MSSDSTSSMTRSRGMSAQQRRQCLGDRLGSGRIRRRLPGSLAIHADDVVLLGLVAQVKADGEPLEDGADVADGNVVQAPAGRVGPCRQFLGGLSDDILGRRGRGYVVEQGVEPRDVTLEPHRAWPKGRRPCTRPFTRGLASRTRFCLTGPVNVPLNPSAGQCFRRAGGKH